MTSFVQDHILASQTDVRPIFSESPISGKVFGLVVSTLFLFLFHLCNFSRPWTVGFILGKETSALLSFHNPRGPIYQWIMFGCQKRLRNVMQTLRWLTCSRSSYLATAVCLNRPPIPKARICRKLSKDDTVVEHYQFVSFTISVLSDLFWSSLIGWSFFLYGRLYSAMFLLIYLTDTIN